MVVPPGYSLSDLIQALGQIKKIYDAFCDEHSSSSVQLRELADDIEEFRTQLKQHQDIVEERGLEYDHREKVKKTLEQCAKLLGDYEPAAERRKSIIGAYRTIKFAYKEKDVQQLREQIARHQTNIVINSGHIILSESSTRKQRKSVTKNAALIENSPVSTSPTLATPASPLYENPWAVPEGTFAISSDSRRSSTSTSATSDDQSTLTQPDIPYSPQPDNIPRHVSNSIPATSPNTTRTFNSAETFNDRMPMPELSLPQPALSYTVAKVEFRDGKGRHEISLKRKPIGRSLAGGKSGREVVTISEDREEKFKHIIRIGVQEECYPYTWHSRWRDNNRSSYKVSFRGSSTWKHNIFFNRNIVSKEAPDYFFTKIDDFLDFQSAIRGKTLEDTFEVREISSGSSNKREATDQHLKLWKDTDMDEYSLSFYANANSSARDLEFPLHMFDVKLKEEKKYPCFLKLKFGDPPEKKSKISRAFTFSSTSGLSSPSYGTASSATKTIHHGFSFDTNGVTPSEYSATTLDSLASSLQSNSSSNSQITLSNSGPSIEQRAKKMKCLSVEFSETLEAARFKQKFERLYRVQSLTKTDLIMDWTNTTGHNRPESVLSASPGTTPLTRSPALAPLAHSY